MLLHALQHLELTPPTRCTHRLSDLGNARYQKAAALLPPPLQPLVQQLLESLPPALCNQSAQSVTSIPAAWKDSICPAGLITAPLRAVKSALKPWGLVIAAAAFNASLKFQDEDVQARPGITTTYNDGNETTYIGANESDVVTGDVGEAYAKAISTREIYRAAYNRVRAYVGERGGRERCMWRQAVIMCSHLHLLITVCACVCACVRALMCVSGRCGWVPAHVL